MSGEKCHIVSCCELLRVLFNAFNCVRAKNKKNKNKKNVFRASCYHTSFVSIVKLFWSRFLSCLYKLKTNTKLEMRTTGKIRNSKIRFESMLPEKIAVYRNLKLQAAYRTAQRKSSPGCCRWKFPAAAVFAGLFSAPPQQSSR